MPPSERRTRLDDATLAAIERDLAAAQKSLAHGDLQMLAAPPPMPSNGVYRGLVRPRPARNPATAGVLAKVVDDLRVVLAAGVRVVVESGVVDRTMPASREPSVPDELDASDRPVIEGVLEGDER